MRSILPRWSFLILLAPALALGQSGDASVDQVTHGPALHPERSAVLLHSGELIEGPLEVIARRGVVEHIAVGETSYPHYLVRAYSTGEQVYGLADVGEATPVLVVRHSTGRAGIYRHTNRDNVRTDFFQIGTGPILLASGRYLRQAFEGDPAAMRHLRRDRLLVYVGAGAVVVGASMVATAAAIEFADLDGVSGIVFGLAGVGFAVAVNTVVPPARQRARRAAIEAFNR